MKQYIFLFILNLIISTAFCQEVLINGDHKNRLLTWDDFTGKPDKSSVHEANTYWKLNYRFQGITFNGDTAKFNELSVKLELDKDKTWIKSGKETPGLLKHEQGHFDIGLLCQQEIIHQFNNKIGRAHV